MPLMTQPSEARFASFVATFGRGPGRSRALTREEAQTAFGMILRGEADPHQVGAFLMLLRFRGEDAEEITGLVQAVRSHARLGWPELGVDLDWPSYGAGRTRGAPWFLLSALALARSGITVLMHGSNDFSAGISGGGRHGGAWGCGRIPTWAPPPRHLRSGRFAYLPLRAMAPEVDRLLEMRRLFGLRSPVNTAARLLNPADAPFGVDGVFHPPYIDVHLGVAERMDRRRLLVLKGGGGEAERVPLKPATASVWDREAGRQEVVLPAMDGLAAAPAGQRYDGGVRRGLERGSDAGDAAGDDPSHHRAGAAGDGAGGTIRPTRWTAPRRSGRSACNRVEGSANALYLHPRAGARSRFRRCPAGRAGRGRRPVRAGDLAAFLARRLAGDARPAVCRAGRAGDAAVRRDGDPVRGAALDLPARPMPGSAIRPSCRWCSWKPSCSRRSCSTARRSPSRTWRCRCWAACSIMC